MLVFYLWRFRMLWVSPSGFWYANRAGLQIGRMLFDWHGGRGIAWAWHGRVHHALRKGRS